MPITGRFGRQLRSWLFKASVEEEVDAELTFHVDMRARELVARGVAPDEARRQASARLGNVAQVSDELRRIARTRDRSMHRREWWATLVGDVRVAARQLRRSASFTTVAVGTLALGIGATTAVFTLMHAVVLRPLPFAEPARVVQLGEVGEDGEFGSLSVPAFLEWSGEATAFSSVAAVDYWSYNLAQDGVPERVSGARVTPGYFDVFAVPPTLGRTFQPDDGEGAGSQVVVLSHGLWQQRFAGDPRVVGSELRLDGVPHTVIGVAGAALDFDWEGTRLWVPLVFDAPRRARYDEHYLDVVGRLAPGVSLARAEAEAVPVARVLESRSPLEYKGRSLGLTPYAELVGGRYRDRFLLLLGAVGLVLLIGCANVANLLLARGAARGKELAIRGALGAGRERIVRQLLTESLLLAIVGGVLGVAIAAVAVRAFVASAPNDIPRLAGAALSAPALAFALVASLACTLLFGLLPAVRASRLDLQEMLRDGGRGSRGTVRDRVRGALVTAEVALAMVLLTGAGLLVRTSIEMQRVDPGFDPERLLTARVTLTREGYPSRDVLEGYFTRLSEALRAAPGIRGVSVTSQSPLGRGGSGNGLIDARLPIDPANLVMARSRFVDPGHFRTLGIRLLEGRDFTPQDVRSSPLVAILSQRSAQRMFPGESAIGKRVGCCEGSVEDPKWKEVIGVVGDVTADSLLSGDNRPLFYVPIQQLPDAAWEWIQRTMTVVVRYDGDEAAATATIRRAAAEVDATVPLFDVASMPSRLQRAYAQSRFNAMLLGSLGVAGLLLAAVGIYGIIAYFVSQRTQEIGVRMALGASRARVVTLVTTQGMRPVLVGVVVGIVASLASARVLASALYRVRPGDPVTLVVVVAVFVVVALLAAVVPARQAAGVEPTRALAG